MASEIKKACEVFLSDWDRQEWMVDHGEWASDQWFDAREEYDAALASLREAVAEAPAGERVDRADDIRAVLDAAEGLRKATEALDGAVRPDESDYIEEGIIDPDGVADRAVDLDVGEAGDGWDCREGWSAYRVGQALYIRDWRDGWGARRSRDLWVLVDGDFFADDEEEGD